MRKWLLWIWLSSLALAQPPEVLNLEQALQRLRDYNPRLQAARARLKQAQVTSQWAGVQPAAQLGVGSWLGQGDALVNSNFTALNRPDAYLFVQQNFRPLGQPEFQRRAAAEARAGVEADTLRVELELERDLKDGFFRVLAAQAQVQLAEENLRLAEDLKSLAGHKLRAGSGPRLDELNALIQRNRSRQEVVLQRSQLEQQRMQLAALLGYEPGKLPACEGELAPPELVLEPVGEDASRAHPRLRSARSAWQASQARTEEARLEGRPSTGIQAIYDLVRPSYSVQLTLSIPLDWGELGAEVQRRELEAEERKALLTAEELEVRSQQARAWQAYQASWSQARAYFEEVLSVAEETTRITRYGYERGALPYLQLLTSQQQLAGLRQEYVQRLLEAHLALHELELARGRALVQPRHFHKLP